MCQSPKSARVVFFFLSIHIIWEFTRYGLHEKTELLILSFYFMLIGNGKVLRLYLDTHAALPLLASRIFQFCGGKQVVADLPLLSSAVNLSFQFSSAVRGGKLEIAYVLRVRMAEIFQSDFFSFFSLLLLVGGSWVVA